VIGQANKKIRSGKLQRTLRDNMSDAEQALWHHLRGRQIHGLAGSCHADQPCRQGKGSQNDNTLPEAPRLVSGELQFRRQHPFGDYILDFVCLENKLVIEVDGGQHGEQARYDENRTQILQAAGFRVLRFWNNEVLKEVESVREKIWFAVQEVQPHPLPNLPLEGGGVKKALLP
jgi:very-short-patch-repair endonuclease